VPVIDCLPHKEPKGLAEVECGAVGVLLHLVDVVPNRYRFDDVDFSFLWMSDMVDVVAEQPESGEKPVR
jgi:hypothetical protein